MKIGDFELHTGGKFNIEEIINSHTEIDNEGNAVVHLSPEMYDIMIDEWALKTTKELPIERIDQICEFYKNKYIWSFSDEYKPFLSECNVQDEGVYYMYVDHVTYDKLAYTFTIFTKALMMYVDEQCVPIVTQTDDNGLVGFELPKYMNNLFIDIETKDILTTPKEYQMVCVECINLLNETGMNLVRMFDQTVVDIKNERPKKKRKKKKSKKQGKPVTPETPPTE